VLAAAVLLADGQASTAVDQEPTAKPPVVVDEEGAGVHFPRTAADHLAVAEEYVAKAAERREDAKLHRRMLAAYERLVADLAASPAPPLKGGITVPLGSVEKTPARHLPEYRVHCDAYIHGAEALAAEAETLAEFHRARARELRDPREP
jgi:hypothetical protein